MDAAQPAYDLAPALRLAALALTLAALPLAWVWLRGGRAPRGRLALLSAVTVFLCFDLILFGAFTRLTDSGLGCPDWPGCYGQASPWGAQAQISAAQAALPSGPVTPTKAWIEMLHRYFAATVGALILALALAAWRAPARAALGPWWATTALLWVCVQGAFGALTVTLKLAPLVVTAHLLGALVLLALLTVLAGGYSIQKQVYAASRLLIGAVTCVLAIVFIQSGLGAWVSANYAVLACSGFPACNGSWWPVMDFAQGFSLWRPLGLNAQLEPISFQALVAIHYVHRAFAVLVLLALGALAYGLARHGRRRSALALAVAAGWQLLSGVSNVVLGWPLVAALAHTGGAAALVFILTRELTCCRSTKSENRHMLPEVLNDRAS